MHLHYSVVVEEQGLQTLEEWEPIQLSNVIVTEIYYVELVKCGSKVFYDWNLVAWKMSSNMGKMFLTTTHLKSHESI